MEGLKNYYKNNLEKLEDLKLNYKVNKDKFLNEEKDIKKLQSLLFYKRRDVIILENYIDELIDNIKKVDYDYKITFGKFKDKTIKDLDKNYIDYLKQKNNLSDKLLQKYISLL